MADLYIVYASLFAVKEELLFLRFLSSEFLIISYIFLNILLDKRKGFCFIYSFWQFVSTGGLVVAFIHITCSFHKLILASKG